MKNTSDMKRVSGWSDFRGHWLPMCICDKLLASKWSIANFTELIANFQMMRKKTHSLHLKWLRNQLNMFLDKNNIIKMLSEQNLLITQLDYK